MTLREKLDAWIGEAPVRINLITRETYKNEEGQGHSAFISIHDGVLFLETAITGEAKVPHPFILAHDIGHFLAADDADLSKPNLGLGTGPTTDDRREWERNNEELTFAYQWALLKALGGDFDLKMETALKIFKNVVGVRREEVIRLRDSVDVRAEWNRKMALITSMTRPVLSIAA